MENCFGDKKIIGIQDSYIFCQRYNNYDENK